jgi:hypothetical protein
MLYWLSVYGLVALMVAAPFLLVYLAGYVLWWSFIVIGLAGRRIGNALKARRPTVKRGRGKYESPRHHDEKCIVHP